MKPLAEIEPAEWLDVMTVNLTAAFLGARTQIPAMSKLGSGVLVFTGSFVGNSVGLPGMAAYAAAKAGLMGLVRGIAADYAAAGIRANALLPGGTATEMAGDAAQREWAAGLHAIGSLNPKRSPRRLCSWPATWRASSRALRYGLTVAMPQ